MSVITAGVYERTWEVDGATYTHIFDPRTGVPISGDLQSVTVVADDAVAGDALSTAFMVIGPALATDLLRILPGVDAVFVSGAGPAFDVLATEGLRNSIELLNRDCTLSFVDAD
jgi:thiamine biosynthesis lipoprotein